MASLVDRLRTDFGKCTLGQLLQDRADAATEIERLTRELSECRARGRGSTSTPTATKQVTAPLGARSPAPALLRLKQVSEIVGLSRSTIYNAIHAGTFPRPIRVGGRAVRWKATEIQGWMDERESPRSS
ncbi:MAG: AlpA family transcriptional regulator [Burkholderiales bacterium]